jgi:hypothetical protein
MNLVLGCATNYQIDQIRNFVISLRKFYSGRILLVYNKNSISEDVNFFFNMYEVVKTKEKMLKSKKMLKDNKEDVKK